MNTCGMSTVCVSSSASCAMIQSRILYRKRLWNNHDWRRRWRGDNINPPLDFCEHLREPRCPKELVRAFPMAGGMKPHLVLVHHLFAHSPIYLLFASSTDRVRDWVAVLHELTLLTLYSREYAMMLAQSDWTSPHL